MNGPQVHASICMKFMRTSDNQFDGKKASLSDCLSTWDPSAHIRSAHAQLRLHNFLFTHMDKHGGIAKNWCVTETMLLMFLEYQYHQ